MFKLKNNINPNLVIVIVFLFITGLFYWFQWRPSEIRKECAKLATTDRGLRGLSSNLPIGFNEDTFKRCMLRNGLKP